ncbi:hypothetical protein [Rhizobium leguminosarum]|uniref:hypothetical protein n=1 Tax=Rhizobium leguminosarum TaxID=384 RepID=UPI0015DA403D|nr:hypothetical protein [Rhizobium leguminosarum]NZD50495.1 hypothetical protein [Rhizobium leguminosarum]
MKPNDRIREQFPVDHVDGQRVIDIIATLQAALDAVPTEYRNEVRLVQEAYDWGDTYLEVDRPPNAAEIAESERLKADRAALVEASTQRDADEWVRKIRVLRGCSRDDAEALILDGTESVAYHPKYNRETKTIVL